METHESLEYVQIGFPDEEDLEAGTRHSQNAKEELKCALFGDGEATPPEDIGEEEEVEGGGGK